MYVEWREIIMPLPHLLDRVLAGRKERGLRCVSLSEKSAQKQRPRNRPEGRSQEVRVAVI